MARKKPEAETFLKNLAPSATLAPSILASYGGGVLVVGQAWLLAFLCFQLFFQHTPWGTLLPYVAALGGIIALRFGCAVLADMAANQATIHIKNQLRHTLYQHIRTLGPQYVTQYGAGSLSTSLLEGVETCGKYYKDFLPAQALAKYLPLSILICVFPVDKLAGTVMLVTAPMIPIFMILIGQGTEKKNQQQWDKLARMSNHFLDIIQGLPTLKMFNATTRTKEEIRTVAEEYRHRTMDVLKVAFLSSLALEFFSTVSIALVAVFVGFRLLWGDISFFYGLFVLLLVPEFYLPLPRLGTAYHAKMEALGAVENIQRIMAQQSPQAPQNSATIPTTAPTISFRNVQCRYGGERNALQNLSCTFESGKTHAIVGASGAGKSTIFSLILGMAQAEEGELNINGTALANLPIHEWRQHISWVPQNPTLFHGTVMENIKMGNPDATDEDVYSICKHLGLHVFLSGLPHGYATKVGEKGVGLSTGQGQRIAMARALLRDAPVILLDEPTAALDTATETALQAALPALFQNKTVIIIAHRLHTIRQADTIFVLEDGQLIGEGNHQQLLKTCPHYAEMIRYEIPTAQTGESA